MKFNYLIYLYFILQWMSRQQTSIDSGKQIAFTIQYNDKKNFLLKNKKEDKR